MTNAPPERRIEVLADDLANQIAAGEVVERPASVVKELVENAIDAGAMRIDIEVQAGGTLLARVADDGVGMSERDARLAALRHATSKIAKLDDLRKIESFGFRGEALPSIASVSRFSLTTRRRGESEGTHVAIEGGGAMKVTPCGAAVGTIVEVRDLFFNVPARKKFLRAVSAESARVGEVALAAALSVPSITVVLTRDGKRAREWLRATSREERARLVFAGDELAACRGQRGPLSVEAFVSRPERARAGSMNLWVFVNGRHVQDRRLARAVANAYGSVLPPGRYPVGVVYLDLPHELVDVNVHPQKAEVRFADTRAVESALFRIIGDALQGAFGLVPPGTGFPGRKPKLFEEEGATGPSTWSWSSAPSDAGQGLGRGPEIVAHQTNLDPWGLAPAKAPTPAPRPYAEAATREARPLEASDAAEKGPPAGPKTAAADAPPQGFATLRFIAQVRRMFLLCEGESGLFILDQHAAAERVTFDKLRRAFHAKSVATQRLLFPTVVEVTGPEAALVEEAESEIAAAGMDVRAAGPTSVAVHAVPTLLGRASPERLVRDLLGELSRGGERAFSQAIDIALATMACHGSVRAGDLVSPDEAKTLLAALDVVDFAGHCPHGRPIVMGIGWNELSHGVGRR